MRDIEPTDLMLLLAELLEGAPVDDLRDLRRILTVLPAEDVKDASLDAVQARLRSGATS